MGFPASRAAHPPLSHHAKSFKASVASLAQPLQPHQPPAAARNSACPLGWAGREGSRARTPRTPKHPEQLEVPSSHPASQKNNQNKKIYNKSVSGSGRNIKGGQSKKKQFILFGRVKKDNIFLDLKLLVQIHKPTKTGNLITSHAQVCWCDSQFKLSLIELTLLT